MYHPSVTAQIYVQRFVTELVCSLTLARAKEMVCVDHTS